VMLSLDMNPRDGDLGSTSFNQAKAGAQVVSKS
jgi:hypothetical protein